MDVVILDHRSLYLRAADVFVKTAQQAVRERGAFRVALSGGSTPKGLYSLLADPYSEKVNWANTQVLFSDERCVPPDHHDSNYRMVEETMLNRIDISAGNIHRMHGEIEPVLAAKEYSETLRLVFNLKNGDLPSFDLMLLGIGEDCHTASVFPESEVIDSDADLTAAVHVPKLKSWRLTLTPPVLQHSRRILVLAIGEAKADAIKRAFEGDYDPHECPAQLLRQARGEVLWLVDEEAGRYLLASAQKASTEA